ncbi:MAG: EamA family transporter [Rhizobiales bacterium]|nr:EamA family transporter [Hyphomicrobiales bacterium]
MTRPTANLLLLVAAIIWGSAFVAQTTAMNSLGPIWFVGLRFLIAAACVAPFVWIESRHATTPLQKSMIRPMLLIGTVFFIGCVLQQIALTATSITNAGFLTGLYVLIVPLLGWIFFRERPPQIVGIAILLALGGTWALSTAGAKSALAPSAGLGLGSWGDMLALGGAFFWAAQVLLLGRLAASTGRPMAVAFFQFLITGLAGTLFGLMFETLSLKAVTDAAFELFYVGAISGGLAFTLQVMAQRVTHASEAAVLLSSEALFAALFGALLLGETMGLIGWAGAALILVAILIVQIPAFQPTAKS